MSNFERLTAAGLIGAGTQLSAKELEALAAMSDAEISALVSAKMQIHPDEEKPIVPTYHVGF